MKKEFENKRDSATGLLNKDAFWQEVEQYLSERSRNVTDVLIVINIDDFRLVNDRFGEPVGDEVIVRLSGLVKENFAERSFCGRSGGDEFVVFMKDIQDIGEIELQAEQFRENFSDIGFGQKGNVYNTLSIGVSYNSGVDTSFRTMFTCADEALLKAKEYGKNRVVFFEIKRGLLKYVE